MADSEKTVEKTDDFLEEYKNTVDELGKAYGEKAAKIAEKDLKKNNAKFMMGEKQIDVIEEGDEDEDNDDWLNRWSGKVASLKKSFTKEGKLIAENWW